MHFGPIDKRQIEPQSNPASMAKIGRNVKALGSTRNQSFARSRFSPAVESQPPVAVVIVQEPTKSAPSDLQAQVCLANSDGFGQRPYELPNASLALRAGHDVQAPRHRRTPFSRIRMLRSTLQESAIEDGRLIFSSM